MAITEDVEGFSVFKSSKSAEPEVEEDSEKPGNQIPLEKKKFYQQLEVRLVYFSLK